MNEFCQNESLRRSLPKAILNPEKQEFHKQVQSARLSILEIGCGYKPRVSWVLGDNQLWVGCDPAISSTSDKLIEINSPHHNPQGRYVVYSYDAGDAKVPCFQPDVVSAIAPNQEDIIDGRFFNDELKKFLGKRRQLLVVILDKRTHEARYNKEAVDYMQKWMKEYGFKPVQEFPGNLPRLKPNSADLGAGGIHISGIRNPNR